MLYPPDEAQTAYARSFEQGRARTIGFEYDRCTKLSRGSGKAYIGGRKWTSIPKVKKIEILVRDDLDVLNASGWLVVLQRTPGTRLNHIHAQDV